MACPNKNRYRPKTIAFRVTEDEDIRIVQRVKITGEVKGDYLRSMALNGDINITVGKFKSDKLALAIKKLSEVLRDSLNAGIEEEISNKILETNILLDELQKLMTADKKEKSL
jgi:hypothetical protein